ncbi:hypothetical protein SAMN02910384_02644 [Pseudobutyrivibrio sp. ACV-2]|uniref:hypothetical protein n=1 Tax=Pseudobutyrivibrio sp. ACV-2 TaxID=1520801 RepID=UPI00089CAFF1|nr:hypothetical protein [Pseudobutyrivibrio sp. ACV-2]SEA88919.1 hypothetical protein SAMN02910384_02644 [Pseudobutyrivibrio sp. ACV-2]
MIINDSENNFPLELINIAQNILPLIPVQNIKKQYPDINSAEYKAEVILKNYICSVDCFESFSKHSSHPDDLFYKFYKETCKHKIVCHHYTRVLDPNDIEANGLRPNNWKNIYSQMLKTLTMVGLDEQSIKAATNNLHNFYTDKYPDSANDINYTTAINSDDIKKFTTNIGGELGACLESDTDLWHLLISNGTPIRVDFVANITDDSKFHKLVHYLLIRILTQLIWGTSEDDYDYAGIIKKPIDKNITVISLNKNIAP